MRFWKGIDLTRKARDLLPILEKQIGTYAFGVTNEWLRPNEHGGQGCWWPGDDVQYIEYHDTEWGRPVIDDTRLFEKLCLEGFQAGLSWLTILRKRENFRTAFHAFDMDEVARFSERDINRLLEDAGIVRHRGKIEATINNAGRALDLIDETGSLTDFIWRYAPDVPFGRDGESIHASGVPSISPSATALSKELKKRGWKFVGPTTVYSFMQSMGLVNDHVDGCHVRSACETARQSTIAARK
jgi:DNA-3-methyladenine glycosylase I